ncbi:cytidine deaminase [Legionella londiniensis]|uniref:Cytidine deaminase n=1 Tax=Legionella londiniensis TaxID=45068 RepID=A0A0W0VQE2_9GAMM|nr:cytidine deaminase [Legionella londiniensis]KTD22332.1 cytidine deaminase [Legionella londiniensis]STX88227.1 cytidine deaminase [Legionella londiniensis]STX93094.1 cytidine deaminase [Legionella londiniensis]
MNELIQRMIKEASHALQNAYAPYSHFAVACCLRSNDDLFTGVNVENSSYGLTICAESSAISQMIAAGKQRINELVLIAGNNLLCSPCGGCRQRIYEFSDLDTKIHLCSLETVLKTATIEELLPLAFNMKS